MFSRLQYISRGNTAAEQLQDIQEALDAGCDWIQLRFKNAPDDVLLELASKVKKICTDYNAIFIINDNARIAHQVDADGTHLGLDDMDVNQARQLLGPHKIIGGTANTIEHVRKRIQEHCNYIGLGPYRFTATKANLSPLVGLEGYLNILAQLNKERMAIPVYAIGGINTEDISALRNAGIYGVAVSGALHADPDKKSIVLKLKECLYAKTKNS